MNAFAQFGGADEEDATTLRWWRQFQPLWVHSIGHHGATSVREAEVCFEVVPHRGRWTNGKVSMREKRRLIWKFFANAIQVRLWWLPIGKSAAFVSKDAL